MPVFIDTEGVFTALEMNTENAFSITMQSRGTWRMDKNVGRKDSTDTGLDHLFGEADSLRTQVQRQSHIRS